MVKSSSEGSNHVFIQGYHSWDWGFVVIAEQSQLFTATRHFYECISLCCCVFMLRSRELGTLFFLPSY